VPADSDIAELTYDTNKHTLSIMYHTGSSRIVCASRNYRRLVQGDGGDDDVEWNVNHHDFFHVMTSSRAASNASDADYCYR